MRMPANLRTLALLPLFVCLVFFAVNAHAAIDNAGVFDSVLDRYQAAASGWAGVITTAATRLFWTLVVMSMVWTFGMMALRKADIGEFFAELVRFTIFTGFFWWALTNGPNFASSIYSSLRQLAGNATGLGNALTPSGIVDVGFAIFDQVMDQSSLWSPVDSMAGILMALGILIILSLVGVNILLLLASGWVLAYGGVFFLGFGGSRWTSDMAINYYKTVLGVAAQLFAMVLLVGIGKTFLDDYYSRMSAGISLKEMGVMLIVVIILLALTNRIPPLIAGIITGASVGGAGIGQLSAGAAMGAAGMASAAAATAGAAFASGAASAAGSASAVISAFSKAHENVTAGTDLMSVFSGSRSSSRDGNDAGIGGTPFAQAAGFGSSSGSSSLGGSSKGAEKSRDKDSSSTASADNRSAKAAHGDAKAVPGSTGSSLLSSAASALGTAGRITADASANLAKGTADVAKSKVASLRDAAVERIADTTGGKIAAAIKAGGSGSQSVNMPDQQPAPSFGGNSLAAGSHDADPAAEVAAFTNRWQGNDGTAA